MRGLGREPYIVRGRRRRRSLNLYFTTRTWGRIAAGVLVAGLVASGASYLPLANASTPAGAFSGAHVYVIDGDTIRLPNGERVRILNIDTPEMPPRAECELEAKLAYAAKARTLELIRAGEIALYAGKQDRDRYGRLLRRVEVGGRDLGSLLVEEGLAQAWRGRKATWCKSQSD